MHLAEANLISYSILSIAQLTVMKVFNLKGTGDKTCECGSWVNHWEKFSGRVAVICSASGCLSMCDAGAHVIKGGGSIDQSHYIVPLCSEHNAQTGELDISNETVLVSANVDLTCEK